MRPRDDIIARMKQNIDILLQGERDALSPINRKYYHYFSPSDFVTFIRQGGIVELFSDLPQTTVQQFSVVNPLTRFLSKHLDKLGSVSSRVLKSRTVYSFPSLGETTVVENPTFKKYITRLLNV